MNETKNHYKKCSHYIIGASFDSSICFHYFVLLWYVYDLVFWGIECRIHRVRAEAGAGGGRRLSGKQRDPAVYTQYSHHVVVVVQCIRASMCIFNPGLLFLKRDLLIPLFSGSLPQTLVWSMIEKHIWIQLQLPFSPCDLQKGEIKGRGSDFQH